LRGMRRRWHIMLKSTLQSRGLYMSSYDGKAMRNG
jgi:hypothetical protein